MHGSSFALQRAARRADDTGATVTSGRAPLGSRIALAGLLLAASACRSPGAERPPEARFERMRATTRNTGPVESSGWLRFSLGVLDREQPDGDPVGDGSLWGIEGGVDLARTVLTPSLETGAAFTSANVSTPGVDDVRLWRAFAGLRGTWHADGWRPYARAGGFVRWSSDDLHEPFDPAAFGVYAGAGADWSVLEGLWVGPSVTWYGAIGEDAPGGDGQELGFALSATFRL